jgi:hypothetical protein
MKNNNSNQNTALESKRRTVDSNCCCVLIVKMQANSQIVMADQKKKLIKIDPNVHKELNEVGLRGESFSDIIHRLVKFYKGTREAAADMSNNNNG